MANFKRHVTCEFTNNTSYIYGREGYRQISIKNMASSINDVLVVGDDDFIGGITSSALHLKPGDILTLGDENHTLDIDGISITALENTTCQLIGIRYIQNM